MPKTIASAASRRQLQALIVMIGESVYVIGGTERVASRDLTCDCWIDRVRPRWLATGSAAVCQKCHTQRSQPRYLRFAQLLTAAHTIVERAIRSSQFGNWDAYICTSTYRYSRLPGSVMLMLGSGLRCPLLACTTQFKLARKGSSQDCAWSIVGNVAQTWHLLFWEIAPPTSPCVASLH